MQCAILNNPLKQHPTKEQLYSHLPLISQTIKVRQIQVGYRWRRKDELISDIHLWTITYGPPMLADRQKFTHICSAWTLNAAKKTYQEWWMIGMDGEKEAGNFVRSARLDDDNDDDNHTFQY